MPEIPCDICGTPGTVDELSEAEARDTFSSQELEGAGVVCHGCWLRMREQLPELDARYEGAGW